MGTQVVNDDDLRYAGSATVKLKDDLEDFRERFTGVLEELGRRLEPLSEQLKRWQKPAVASVAGRVNIAFVAVMVILMAWPDVALPVKFIVGFRIVGLMEALIFTGNKRCRCLGQ